MILFGCKHRDTTDVFHELIAFVVLDETYGEEEIKTAIGKVDYRKLETMV